MHGNKRGGAMASEGGAIDILGEYTQGTCVVVGNVWVVLLLLRSFSVPNKVLSCCRVVVLSCCRVIFAGTMSCCMLGCCSGRIEQD